MTHTALISDDLEITPKFKVEGVVEGVFQTTSPEDFLTVPVETLELTFEGVPGGRHAGFTRKSGGREAWYPRGTEMCNERQVSLLSVEELDIIAGRMELGELKSEWIGGNIAFSGIPNFSQVPPRTRLVFEGGAVLRVDGDNAPCRVAGNSIAANNPGREGLDLLFPQKAKRLRGLVGYVEVPGVIKAGEKIIAQIPEQWIYPRG
jgi:MOSC domain-containing protein